MALHAKFKPLALFPELEKLIKTEQKAKKAKMAKRVFLFIFSYPLRLFQAR